MSPTPWRRANSRLAARGRRRYRLLLEQAFADLAEDPHRPGARVDPDLPAGLRLYPIRLSRARVSIADRVGRPRHVVVFRLEQDGVVVTRLLDEAMDLPGRVSEEPGQE